MRSTTAFWSGVAVVVGTHTMMLVRIMPEDIQKYHALLNLAAAGLIVYGASE
jgi:hypothetical protein